MSCKCGADRYAEHRRKVDEGEYPGHIYTGHFWAPTDAPDWHDNTEEEQ